MKGRIFIFIGFVLSLHLSLYAHPHIFIDCSVEFVWEKTDLKGFYVEWEFDRFFSADIIRSFDTDRNGVFDAQETRKIFQSAFSNLKNFHYFTFIRQGKQRTSPASVSQFSVSQKNGQVIYRFFVELSRFPKGDLFVAIYDYTFFCDVRFREKSPVKLTYDPAYVKPSYLLQENRDYPVYYDPLSPASDTRIYTEWRKGLMTFYPKEIKITYGSS